MISRRPTPPARRLGFLSLAAVTLALTSCGGAHHATQASQCTLSMSAIDKARASLHGSLAWGAFTQAQKSLTTPAGQAQARFVQEQSKAFIDTLPANHDCGIKQLSRKVSIDSKGLTPATAGATARVSEDFRNLATAAAQAGLSLASRNLKPN